MRTLIIILTTFIFNTYMFSQIGYIDKINKLNKNGHKEGLWVENYNSITNELYYKDGQKSGVFKSYTKKGKLSAIGEYTNGKITGTWYHFGDYGHLMSIQKDFRINNNTVILDSGKRYVYPYKCYTINYYPNGVVEAEGFLLWEEDPEMDTAREYGEWKYYDETGKLIKTKEFK